MSNNLPTTQTSSRDIRTLLQSDKVKDQLRLALPRHMTADRMTRVALTAILRTPKLLNCTPESLLQSLMVCSQVGLEPDGRNAHLIPYGNTCQVIFDYKGLVSLARRNGVKAIHSDVVCEADQFDVTFDGGPKLTHKIDYKKPRGSAYAAYCYFVLDGEADIEVMQRDEIEAIRRRSRAGESGPWQTDWNEMAKKTVIRRASKKWPLDPDTADALAADADSPATVSVTTGPSFATVELPPAHAPTPIPAPVVVEQPAAETPVVSTNEPTTAPPESDEMALTPSQKRLSDAWDAIKTDFQAADFNDMVEYLKFKYPKVPVEKWDALDTFPDDVCEETVDGRVIRAITAHVKNQASKRQAKP